MFVYLITACKDHAFLVSCIAISIIYLIKRRYDDRSPPGPTYIPLIGLVPGLIADVRGREARQWSQQYNSRVIMFRLMGIRMVVINSLDLIRDTYVRRADLVDRMAHINLLRVLDPRHTGIVLSSGQVWKEARRVTLRRMRDFGASGSRAETFIQREAEYLVARIGQYAGAAFDPRPVLSKAVSNVLNQAMFGKRFDYDDKEFERTLKCIEQFVRDFADPEGFLLMSYKLGRLIFWKKLREMRQNWKIITRFVDDQVEEHERCFNGTVQDVIDAFIDDRQNGEGKFDSHEIRSIVLDMFGAGSDTTIIQLKWFLLYMARYEDAQQRVYEELLEAHVSGHPSLGNRTKTPFTDAVIYEIMRLHPLNDVGIPRTNQHHDFTIDGYTIKKGTPVLANYWGVHYNEEYFPNPEEFDPGHFLTDDGQLKNQDKMVSFTVGRRSCAGESLARVEMYLFFAMLIMKFRIRAPEGAKFDFTPRTYHVNEPCQFEIRMIPRQ